MHMLLLNSPLLGSFPRCSQLAFRPSFWKSVVSKPAWKASHSLQWRSSIIRKSALLVPQAKGVTSQAEPDQWLKSNAERLRALPLAAGSIGIVGVLVNRLVSGIAPVVDASSSQSRADVLVIILSAVLLLTGLQWLALKPKSKSPVELEGEHFNYMQPDLNSKAKQELNWLWESMRQCSSCQAVVVVYKNKCIAHLGAGRPGHHPAEAFPGVICGRAMSTGKGNYLANLSLYPGRVEFTTFLPEKTQAVVVQPIGIDGVLVAASNVQRGFTRLDQAWVSTLADKLEQSLESLQESSQQVPTLQS